VYCDTDSEDDSPQALEEVSAPGPYQCASDSDSDDDSLPALIASTPIKSYVSDSDSEDDSPPALEELTPAPIQVKTFTMPKYIDSITIVKKWIRDDFNIADGPSLTRLVCYILRDSNNDISRSALYIATNDILGQYNQILAEMNTTTASQRTFSTRKTYDSDSDSDSDCE